MPLLADAAFSLAKTYPKGRITQTAIFSLEIDRKPGETDPGALLQKLLAAADTVKELGSGSTLCPMVTDDIVFAILTFTSYSFYQIQAERMDIAESPSPGQPMSDFSFELLQLLAKQGSRSGTPPLRTWWLVQLPLDSSTCSPLPSGFHEG